MRLWDWGRYEIITIFGKINILRGMNFRENSTLALSPLALSTGSTGSTGSTEQTGFTLKLQ